MDYDAWPEIGLSCPVCNQAGCAIFRGYYLRFLFCTELEFFGRLVIRTGFCKVEQVRFSLLPDFILYRHRISRFSHERLVEARVVHQHLVEAIDELVGDLGEEFYLPISTAHSYLSLSVRHPP